MKFTKRVIKIRLEKLGGGFYIPDIAREGQEVEMNRYVLGYEPEVEFPHGLRFVVHQNHYGRSERKWGASEIRTGFALRFTLSHKEAVVMRNLKEMENLSGEAVEKAKATQASQELNPEDGFEIPSFKKTELKIYMRDVANETSALENITAYRPVGLLFPIDLLFHRPLTGQSETCKTAWTLAHSPSGRCLNYNVREDLVSLKAHNYVDEKGEANFGWSEWWLTQGMEGWSAFRHEHRELLYFETVDYLEKFKTFHGAGRLHEMLKKIERVKR